MFEIGEKVVHSVYGICTVKNISEHKFPGKDPQLFYELSPLDDGGYGTTIYLSIDEGDKIRRPMTSEEILRMIDRMPETVPLKIGTSGNRTLDMENAKAAYSALMSSGKPGDWVTLLRTIYVKGKEFSAKKKRLSEFELNAREKGEWLLFGEIADVMGIAVSDVEEFITQRIEAE